LLAGAGYAVLSACDGVQALDIFGSEKVDLVLVDYALPGMNGGIVAEGMKAHMPQVPVVMVSGGGVPDQYLSICDGHVRKTDGPELLLRTIRELLFPASSPVVERSQKAS
jgi:CheY-like chemotaxis protein